jgi:predicted outer membrane repeat protein
VFFNSGYTRVSHTASSVEYQGCRFLSTESDQEGGAIQSNGSTIVIKNSLFDGCQSSSDGGALYAINSTVTISGNTRFFRNTSVGGGGAICVDSSTLNISGCHIGGEDSGSGNSAGYQGGALFMVSSTAVVSDSFIRKNSSVASGGGILSTLSLLTLINTEVSANHAGINGIGGGISFNSANQDGFLDITNCGFYDNYAGGSSNAGGGAISFFSGSTANVILKLTGTVFDHNYSSGSTTSSAIYFDSSGPENRIVMDSCIVRNTPTDVAPAVRVNSGTGNRIINSLFYGNKAVSSTAYGGAMYLSASSLLVNCTFWDNSSANGGAVFLSGAAPYHVYNTVFYNNADSNAGTGTDNLNTGSNVTLNRYNCFYNGGVSAYNDVDGGGCINSSSDPFLSVTPGNAGFMRPNSLLADSGYTGAISGFTMPSTDLAGNTRVRGGAVDIGAYEAQ